MGTKARKDIHNVETRRFESALCANYPFGCTREMGDKGTKVKKNIRDGGKGIL